MLDISLIDPNYSTKRRNLSETNRANLLKVLYCACGVLIIFQQNIIPLLADYLLVLCFKPQLSTAGEV